MTKTRIALVLAASALAAVSAFAQGLLNRRNGNGRGFSMPTMPAALSESDQDNGVIASASAVDEEAEKDKASDLNFAEAPLDMVLETYSQLVDRTVLKDPATPEATITLKSRPGQKLTKEEQVEAIEVKLEMHGIHLEDYGEKFVRALPRDKARTEAIPFVEEESELEESGRVVSTMITFKNIPIEEAQKALEGLKSQRGQLLVYERIGKINVTDTQMSILRMRQLRDEIDIATPINENVFVRQIKNASAAEIKTALEQIVAESQKELEKAGKSANMAQSGNNARALASTPSGTLLRRPGTQPQQPQPQQPANVESLVTSVSDADRGMIRGKVLIMADERSNKLIVVTAKTNMDFFDKVIEQLDVETTPDTLVRVYRLKYAEAEDVSDMINDLIGNASNGSRNSRDNQNQAARQGSGGNLTRGGAQPQRNNAQSANQRSGDAKAGELTKDNTTVLADKRINGLVVMTQKELLPTVESIIERMDIKLSQVLIETAIIEVTLGDDLSTGVDWVMRGRQRGYVPQTRNGQPLYYAQDDDGNLNKSLTLLSGESRTVTTGSGEDATETTYTASSIPAMVGGMIRDGFVNHGSSGLGGGGGTASAMLGAMADVTTNFFGGVTPIGGGINYLLKSDKLNLSAVIKASKSDSHAKYLASPIIMTVDNKEATIDATESRKFFNGYETSSSYSTYVRTPKYDSKDIGIKIKVKPKINPNGTVMLNVEEEYSQLGAGQSILVDNGDSAVIDTALTRKMTADVLLDNKQTVVLGGLTEKYVSEKETGIPILKDIPWIGKWLFGSVTQSESRKELLVFMTPYVLDDAESAQAEALRRKRALSDPRPWDSQGWSDSGLADPIAKKELLRRLKSEAEKQDEDRQNRLAVEKWKLERAKALEKMSEAERKFWIEQHRDELEKEEKEAFDRQVKEQEDLKALVDSIRENDMRKAEQTIQENERKEKAAAKEVIDGRLGREPAEPVKKDGDEVLAVEPVKADDAAPRVVEPEKVDVVEPLVVAPVVEPVVEPAVAPAVEPVVVEPVKAEESDDAKGGWIW